MSGPPSVVLCGLGGYGETYLRPLLDAANAGRARLVAGVDPSPERSSLLPELRARGIPVHASLDDVHATGTAEVVVLCSPIHLHAPQAVLAMSRGSHVLIEKPLCATVADGLRIAEAQAASGRHAGVGFQWSYCEPILRLKRDIAAGRFGRPLVLKTLALWPRNDTYYGRNRWAGRIRADDGAWILDSPIANATAHYLHNMLFVLGARVDASAEAECVQAELARANPIENHDTAALRVRTGGAELLFYVTHAGIRQHGPVFEYRFERAVVRYAGGAIAAETSAGERIDYGNPVEASDVGKLWALCAAARGRGTPPCPPAAALPHLRVVNGAHDSAEIVDFPTAMVSRDSARRSVAGLDEELERCYAAEKLPSELGSPWARPGRVVILAGYAGVGAAR
jgi:predicted dehydrogenase